MPPFILLLLILVVCLGLFAYTTYRNNTQKRAKEKKRNQYNDRV